MKRALLIVLTLLMAVGITLPSRAGVFAHPVTQIGGAVSLSQGIEESVCLVAPKAPSSAFKACAKGQAKHALPCGPDWCLLAADPAFSPSAVAGHQLWARTTPRTLSVGEPFFRPPRG